MDGLYELTSNEIESYTSYLKDIRLEKTTQYFDEPSTLPNQEIKEYSWQPIPSTFTQPQQEEDDVLNCYFTTGFVKKSSNNFKPLRMCIFAKDTTQFFEIYDSMTNVSKDRSPRMRRLSAQQQVDVETRILATSGQQTLDRVKKTGFYKLPDSRMLDDILRGGI